MKCYISKARQRGQIFFRILYSQSLVMQCAILVQVNLRGSNKERISLSAGTVVQGNKESREVER